MRSIDEVRPDPGDVGLESLLDDVHRVHGLDLRGYAPASLQRRLRGWLDASGHASWQAARRSLLRDPCALRALVHGVSVGVTEMFRDPPFFAALRREVVPWLRSFPHARVWLAGCATGEEAWSLAIVLREEGLEGRVQVYATDLDEDALDQARERVLTLPAVQAATHAYRLAGGRGSFGDYYTARYGRALLDPSLVRRVVFARHDLGGDGEFNEMQLVLCRNVMIYFGPALKERALGLFDGCLAPRGYLGLGGRETLQGRGIAPRYAEVAPALRLYRRRAEADLVPIRRPAGVGSPS